VEKGKAVLKGESPRCPGRSEGISNPTGGELGKIVSVAEIWSQRGAGK